MYATVCTPACLLWLLIATCSASGVDVTVQGASKCAWSNFCSRLTYSKNDYLEKPRKSLLLYACTGGREGTDAAPCLPGDDKRIQLDSVTSVQASQLQLTGFPRGLCLPTVLPKLVSIDLSGNLLNGAALAALTDPAFAECKKMNVTVLSLSDNKIDSLDLADLLSAFPHLEEIYLNNADLKHIHLRANHDISNSTLRVLSLSRNTLISFDLNILNLPGLEIIDLSRTEYADVPIAFTSFRFKSIDNETNAPFGNQSPAHSPSLVNQFAYGEAIKLRRMERVLQNRIEYQLTVNLHAANVAGMFESLAYAVSRYAEHDATQAVRLLSTFIDAFDYIRFDMLHATVDCASVCDQAALNEAQSESNSASSSGPVSPLVPARAGIQLGRTQSSKAALPALVRFLHEHLATLKRIVSTAHFEWLQNVLSVRCASLDTTSHITLGELVSAPESVRQEAYKQDASTNQAETLYLANDRVGNRQVIEKLCGGLERDRVRPFAATLRNALHQNGTALSGRKQAEVSAMFACGCDRCTIQYETIQRVLIIAMDCGGIEKRNFTLSHSVGDSLPRLFRVISQELGSQWRVEWPVNDASTSSATVSESQPDTRESIRAYIDLNLASSRIDAFDNYEPELGYVRNLIVANNSLRELDENLFRSMNALRSLDLRHNQLRTFPSVVILALQDLSSLRLEGNRFDCSCALYSQLFEAQSLQVLHKIIDFHSLTCLQTNARKTIMLTDILKNLSIFLNDCPAVYKIQLRLATRSTSETPMRNDEPVTESSNSDSFREFLSNNVLYILLVCTFLVVILAILFAVCLADYVKSCRDQYAQVGNVEEKVNLDCVVRPNVDEDGRREWSEPVRTSFANEPSGTPRIMIFSAESAEACSDRFGSIDHLSLPKQRCTINMYLTNLINEDKHYQDSSDEAEEAQFIPSNEVATSPKHGQSLKSFSTVHNDGRSTPKSCMSADELPSSTRTFERRSVSRESSNDCTKTASDFIKQRVAIPDVAVELGTHDNTHGQLSARASLDQSATLQQL